MYCDSCAKLIEENTRLRAALEKGQPGLQMVSRWLKERREAALKGGISLQASWEECLKTILRAYQEIDAYLQNTHEALRSDEQPAESE